MGIRDPYPEASPASKGVQLECSDVAGPRCIRPQLLLHRNGENARAARVAAESLVLRSPDFAHVE